MKWLRLVCAALLSVGLPVRGQCLNSGWSPIGTALAGGGYARVSMMWDPDGGGPITPKLIVGGSFYKAGNVLANNIAAYDPATGVWSAMGTGVTGFPNFTEVSALTVDANNNLIVGGDIQAPGQSLLSRGIARWNGTAWSTLGSGLDGEVNALLTMPNGDIIAGGQFSTAGGVNARRIARWTAATSTWTTIGTGMGSNDRGVNALASFNGDIIAGGQFALAGGAPAANIARWDSVASAWVQMGSGMSNSVYALTTYNGQLVAGGSFGTAGGVAALNIARWNGSAWSAMSPGPGIGTVRSLAMPGNGNLIACGGFPGAATSIATWNGIAWTPTGSGFDDTVYTLALLPNGDLAAAGNFTTIAGSTVNHVARSGGAAWSGLAQGLIGGGVFATTRLPNGDVIAGGDFVTLGGTTVRHIARWNGATWSPLGSGMAGASEPWVQALTSRANGDIIAAGWYSTAGGTSTPLGLARWNGTAWSDLSAGFDDNPSSLMTLPNDDVVAVGSFITAGGITVNGVARWNGGAWFAYGAGIADAYLVGLTRMPNGDIVVSGTSFAGFAPVVHRWSIATSTWTNIGDGFSSPGFVAALTALPNGELIAGGEFTVAGGVAANHIAKWNGASWSPLGSGTNGIVVSLATLSNGDVGVGGRFTTADGAPAASVARWSMSGSTWSPLTSGTDGMIRSLSPLPNADLLVGGLFSTAGGQPHAALSRWMCVYANCDNSTSPPICNANDFQCFLNKFAAGDPGANCDGSTVPPVLNVNDFQCFLNAFAAGCS